MKWSLILAGMMLLGCNSKPAAPQGRILSGADAWVVADRATAQTGRTVGAIDSARSIVADNLANVETTGYKRLVCRVSNGQAQTFSEMEQGSLQTTSRDLDLAISGRGFFRVKVKMKDQISFAYTRNGNMFLNNQGNLVVGMGDGDLLDPPINLPNNATNISVSQDGAVQYLTAGSAAKTSAGQVKLYDFVNAERMERIGGSLFGETEASGPPVEGDPGTSAFGKVLQGFLEASNVDLTKEQLHDEFLRKWRTAVLDARQG